MIKTTRAQREALFRLWCRGHQGMTYLQFRRTAKMPWGKIDPYLAVSWCGMYIGIEPDGYTHS